MLYFEKGILFLIMLVLSPVVLLSWLGGHVYGTMKFSFNTGYAGSVSGVEEQKAAARLQEAIGVVMAQANKRPEGSSVQ